MQDNPHRVSGQGENANGNSQGGTRQVEAHHFCNKMRLGHVVYPGSAPDWTCMLRAGCKHISFGCACPNRQLPPL